MTNLKPLLKRVCAYIIDLSIIFLITLLITNIPMLNKNLDDYQKTYEEYEIEYNEYSDYITLLEETYEDEKITSEEYTELTESTKYQELIQEKYDDNKITSGEYKKILTEINDNFDKVAKDYIYILNKQGVSNSVVTLVCTLLYFGVLQYLLKGQTIGKRLFKLKVVSNSNKKINIINYLLRSLVVNDVLLNTVSIIFLLTASKTIYQYADSVISTAISLVEAIIIFLVLTREDGRGLHDLLFNTKVIETDVVKAQTKEIGEEEKRLEKIKSNGTRKTTKHSNSKSKSKSNSKKKIIDAEYKEGSK